MCTRSDDGGGVAKRLAVYVLSLTTFRQPFCTAPQLTSVTPSIVPSYATFPYIRSSQPFSPTWLLRRLLFPSMIRRQPTLIPMTDLDVQDVRDHVAEEKSRQDNQPSRQIGPESMIGLPQQEVQERERRLGMKDAQAR